MIKFKANDAMTKQTQITMHNARGYALMQRIEMTNVISNTKLNSLGILKPYIIASPHGKFLIAT